MLIVEALCTRMSQYASTQEVFDASLPFIAWSTDSVTNYLEDKPFGLLAEEQKAKDWKATIKTVVELTPVVKQIPLLMPLVLKVPVWAMRWVSEDLNRVLVMHNVCSLCFLSRSVIVNTLLTFNLRVRGRKYRFAQLRQDQSRAPVTEAMHSHTSQTCGS